MFYSSYGSYMHRLIERYYRGDLSLDELPSAFLTGFQSNVLGDRPSPEIAASYVDKGLRYFKSFRPFDYKTVAVEKHLRFSVAGAGFRGIIDYIGEKDGELYIVDNKSRDLRPRSGRARPTQKDQELDEMLRQLYIYAAAVKSEYGRFPKALCFNCFKSGVFVSELFDIKAYEAAVAWAEALIGEIKDTTAFYPSVDYFACTYLCGLHDRCCYYEMR